MNKEDRIYEDVHAYTKYKLVEMLINRFQEDKTKLDNLNAIEDLADDVLSVRVRENQEKALKSFRELCNHLFGQTFEYMTDEEVVKASDGWGDKHRTVYVKKVID